MMEAALSMTVTRFRPPFDLDPEDAEPGFLAMEGNLIHRAGEAFEGNVGSGLAVHVLLLIFPTGAR